jgi:Flp pilus assembly protein TadG
MLMPAFRSGHRKRQSRGQALVEFSLVAPIFFLLVFTVIQLGLIFAAQNGLVDGVRSAARRAATYRINEGSFDSTVFTSICDTINAEIEQRLKDRVVGYTDGRVVSSVRYEWVPNLESGEYFLVADVQATFDNQLYVPLINWFLDGADGTVNPSNPVLTLRASEEMRVENPALDTPASLTTQTCPSS